MQVSDITISDFKTSFGRDFAFLPVWSAGSSYNTGEEVYYTNRLFYTCLYDGVTSTPATIEDWRKIADEDGKPINDVNDYVNDTDIQKAFDDATCGFNTSLFNDAEFKTAFLYLAAHCLCLNIRTAMQGVMSKGEFNSSSKSVGAVSESYTIPQSYLKDPILSHYTKTNYGLKYLSMAIPKIQGNVTVAYGATTP